MGLCITCEYVLLYMNMYYTVYKHEDRVYVVSFCEQMQNTIQSLANGKRLYVGICDGIWDYFFIFISSHNYEQKNILLYLNILLTYKMIHTYLYCG